ncbi:DUF29 domain-containing protein [Pseudanabaenaceae cyanobacterium LEGE 13415]|nr:DUF29 domain-containing protein [Pseudanabaenaceae cyanobacterium LEGE 13415]
MTQSIPQVSLYEQDFALWIDDTITKLKAGKFEQLDIGNLVEEIEGLGRSDKRELRNRLNVLLAHILKRSYIDSVRDNGGWILTIREQRRRLAKLFSDSPSLKNRIPEIFDEVYQDALEDVRSEYLKIDFPDEWQFSRDVDALLNDTFWEED